MAKLTPRTPAANLLPRRIGDISLTEVVSGHMTLLTPRRGGQSALSAALKTAHGMSAPTPGRATGRDGARAIWFGTGGQILLMGPAADPTLNDLATMVDQSDAWTVLRIDGAGADAVMARLVSFDIRPAVFKRGHAARAQVGHMAGAVQRLGDQSWQVMAFRSMAATLVHECDSAARAVSARSSP